MTDSAHAEHLLTVVFQQRMCYILINTDLSPMVKNAAKTDVCLMWNKNGTVVFSN